MSEEYDDPVKQVAWEAWLESWRMNNRGDMDLENIHINTARTRFERWWSREK